MTHNAPTSADRVGEAPAAEGPAALQEELDERLDEALSRIRRRVRESASEHRRRVAMRQAVREMLNDRGLVVAMEPLLFPSLRGAAKPLGECGKRRQELSDVLARARRLQLARIEEQAEVMSRRPEVDEILEAMEVSSLETALALSLEGYGEPSEAAAVEAARRSVENADALEKARESAGRLLESAAVQESARSASRAEAATTEQLLQELQELVDAMSRRNEELRTLIQQVIGAGSDVSSTEEIDQAVVFLDEPRQRFAEHLANMLVLTPLLEPAEFDPGGPEPFETTGRRIAEALLDECESDESQEQAPSPSR